MALGLPAEHWKPEDGGNAFKDWERMICNFQFCTQTQCYEGGARKNCSDTPGRKNTPPINLCPEAPERASKLGTKPGEDLRLRREKYSHSEGILRKSAPHQIRRAASSERSSSVQGPRRCVFEKFTQLVVYPMHLSGRGCSVVFGTSLGIVWVNCTYIKNQADEKWRQYELRKSKPPRKKGYVIVMCQTTQPRFTFL